MVCTFSIFVQIWLFIKRINTIVEIIFVLFRITAMFLKKITGIRKKCIRKKCILQVCESIVKNANTILTYSNVPPLKYEFLHWICGGIPLVSERV